MTNRKRNRLDRVEQAIDVMPVRTDLLDKAFEHFTETGELPDEHKLAWEVCRRALNGGRPVRQRTRGPEDIGRIIREMVERGDKPGEPKEVSVRERLFDEAVYAPEVLRYFAREVLKIRIGFLEEDPTDPSWLVDQPLPDCPGLGLFMLGFPGRLAKPPYEEQAERLFARLADLRANRIDHDDPSWQPTLEAAVRDAEDCGVIPAAGLLRDAVLALLEMLALINHSRGEDVGGLMAALDTAARTTGHEREAAIAKLRKIALAGFTDPPTEQHSDKPQPQHGDPNAPVPT